jgi:TRAP-type C4-dicarboxylate transport system substrate-binding protein
MLRPWAERVNAQAKGAIAVEPRDGATIANFANVYERVQDDVVQIGWLLHGVVAGRFPLTDVGALPFIASNGEEASVAFWRLYQSGILDTEYRDIVPLMFGVTGPFYIHLARAPKSLDNLGGLKLSANSKSLADTIQRLGGVPVSIPAGDLYEALQRGTIDGAITGWGAFDPYKLGEVTSFHVMVPLGMTTGALFMSRKRYDSLPATGRKAIEDNAGEAGSRVWGQYFDASASGQRELHKPSDKRKIVELSAEQAGQWRRMVEPVLEGWASSRPDRAQALTAYKSLIEEVQAQTRN